MHVFDTRFDVFDAHFDVFAARFDVYDMLVLKHVCIVVQQQSSKPGDGLPGSLGEGGPKINWVFDEIMISNKYV